MFPLLIKEGIKGVVYIKYGQGSGRSAFDTSPVSHKNDIIAVSLNPDSHIQYLIAFI